MNTSKFEAQFLEFQPLLSAATGRRRYPDRSFWDSVGTHELDIDLTRLAAFYGACRDAQRQLIRSALHPAASWNLVAYVRRMSLQILATREPSWLTLALNIASLENATFDFRDSIVSLVIVRAAAEAVSIETVPQFNKAISQCDSTMIPTLKNARDHRPNDVRDILREFGPPQLKPT